MRRLVIWTLAMAAVLAGGYELYRYQREQNTQKLLRQAKKAAEIGDWKAASTAYRQYLIRRPFDASALAAHADVLLVQLKESPNVLSQAVATLRRLVRTQPDNVDAVKHLVDLYLPLHEYADAQRLAQRWIDLAPDSTEAVISLAAARRGLGRYGEAAAVLDRALARHTQDASLYPPLIELYTIELGHTDKAAALLDTVLKLAPDSYKVQMAAFGFHEQQGHTDQADRHLRAALAIAPDNLIILFAGASFYLSHGRAVDAEPLLDRAETLAPDGRRLLTVRADWAVQTKNPAKIAQAAEALLAHADDEAKDFLARAAELYLTIGRFAQADRCIDRLAAKVGKDKRLSNWLAALRGSRALFTNHPFVAIRDLEAVLRQKPLDRQTLKLLALAYTDARSFDSARGTYQKLLSLSPNAIGPRLALARLELQTGRIDAARAALDRGERGDKRQEHQRALIRLGCDLLALRRDAGPGGKREPVLQAELKQLCMIAPPDATSAELLARCLTEAAFPKALRGLLQERMSDEKTGSIIGAAYGDYLLAQNLPDAAQHLADELKERFARSIVGDVLHVRVLAATQRLDDARQYIQRDTLPDEDQASLYEALADPLLAAGRTEDALHALRSAAALAPLSVAIREKLLAISTKRDDALAVVEEIRAIEGDAGLTWRHDRAQTLLRLNADQATADEAVTLLKECLTAQPEWVSARILIGRAYQVAGDLPKATESFRTAIAQRPGLSRGPVAFQLVQMLKKLGRFDEADAVLQQLARAHPDSPNILRLQTEHYFRNRNLTSAADTAERVLQVRQDDSHWAALTSDIQLRAGNATRAEQIARDSLAHHPHDPSLLWSLARALVAQGRADDAVQTVSISVESQPDVEHYWLWGQILEHLGRTEEAEKALDAALKLGPDNPLLLAACSTFWKARGDPTKQWEFARRAVVARGESPEESLILAGLKAAGPSKADRKEALEIVERRLAAHPDDAEALVLKAQLVGSADPPDLGQAERILQRALSLNSRVRGGHRLLAQVQIRLGRLSQAGETVALGLEITPHQVDLLMMSAEIAGYRGEFDRALAPLRRVLELKPGFRPAVRRLARTYQNMDQIDRAIRFLQKQIPSDRITESEAILLAEFYEAQKDDTQVESWLQRARNMSYDSPESFQALLNHLARRGQYDKLRNLTRERRQSVPDDISSVVVAGQILGSQSADPHLRETGIGWLQAVAADHPDRAADAIYRAGLCYYRHGEPAQAESMFQQASKLSPRSVGPANALAWLYAEDYQKPDEAQALLVRFRSAGGRENAEMLDTYGTVLLRLGKWEQAEEKLTACVEAAGQTPTRTVATFHLALVLEKTNRREKAKIKLQRALALDARLGGLAEKDKAEIQRLLASPAGEEQVGSD